MAIKERSSSAATLSKREREVLRLGASGATDQEISDHLSISVPTLRTYWLRIREKVGAVNRTHAIALVVASAFEESDPRQRILIEARSTGPADWLWRPAERQIWTEAPARSLFGLSHDESAITLDRMLSTVWSADQSRFERYIAQSTELCPMTPFELRLSSPDGPGRIVRTVNLTTHRSRQEGVTVLLASAVTRAIQ